MRLQLVRNQQNDSLYAYGVALSSDEKSGHSLMHYRVGGEKKGVRRWQNKDGSYTSAGYQHYKDMYGWGERGKSAKSGKVTNESSARNPDSFLSNRFGAEFDRGVKAGKNTNDPEIRELYIMERSEAFDTSRDKVKVTAKKLETLRDQSLDNLDKSITSLENENRAESDQYFKMYAKCESDIEATQKELGSEIEGLGKAAGYGQNTCYENDFYRAAGEYAKDKKACAELNTRLKNADAELVGNAKTLSAELESSINAANTAWDKFSGQWVKDHPGKDWDGDGSEFHLELLKQYPEYKKITEQREKNTSEYVKACLKLIKSDAFRDLKYADKFKNYFECIVDPKTGNEWYKAGESAAYALSQVLFPAWSKLDYVDPMYFVESFDKDWKDLGNPRLPA